jgi:hypothetical protein
MASSQARLGRLKNAQGWSARVNHREKAKEATASTPNTTKAAILEGGLALAWAGAFAPDGPKRVRGPDQRQTKVGTSNSNSGHTR